MSRHWKMGVIALAILASSLIAAFVGGSIGFLQGYAYANGDTGARSFTLVTTLRALRKGDVNAGITLLESELDTAIMSHWASRQDRPPILSGIVLFLMGNYDQQFFEKVARYRAEFPSTMPDPDVRRTIASHLSQFASSDERK